jgi:hypothetical protein
MADNGFGPATQSFTLIVNNLTSAPIFTSAASTTFVLNAANTFAITTAASPAVTTITIGGDPLPAGLTFTPGGASATLSGTPTTGTGQLQLTFTASNGVGDPVVQHFTLTIQEGPAITSADNVTIEEASALAFTVTTTGLPVPALSLADPLALPNGVTFTDNGDGTAALAGTPVEGEAGVHVFDIQASNGVGATFTQTFTLTVDDLNRPPTFAKGGDQIVLEDAGLVTVPAWATLITPGANDSGQTVTFEITSNSNPGLFSAGPAVNGTTGDLTFTPAPNANGSAVIFVRAVDNGGATGADVNVSPTQGFTITVTPVNDAPTFVKGPDFTDLPEDSVPTITNPWATLISAGPGDEVVAGQTVTLAVTLNTNESLFSSLPAITNSGDLSFALAANAVGTATITVTATDNGGTADGGVNTSSQTFVISTVNVNDAPSFTVGPNQGVAPLVLEDAGAQTVSNWATAISAGPGEGTQTLTFVVTNNTNAALFAAGPAVSATGELTYTPAANANGTATITLRLDDNGGTANGGVNQSGTQTFDITITAVNDAPSFTKGADVTVLEDSGAASIAGWATDILAGPPNESTQTLTFTVTGNTNTALFSVQPVVNETTGTLTFTPADDLFGTATITLQLSDNGGTANGGADASTQTFVITVTNINEAPSFTAGPDQGVAPLVLEDAGAQTVSNWATGISAGPNEGAQTLTFVVTNNTNTALFAAGPAVSASGELTYTPAANANGTATITLRLDDNGGTDDGGVNQSGTQTFDIIITAVNDAPSFTLAGSSVPTAEDSPGQVATPNWAQNRSAGPPDESGQTLTFNLTGNTNPGLFSVQPAIDPSNGWLTFNLVANAFGTSTVTFTLSDNGGTANLGADTSAPLSFDIVITPVNDDPVAVDDGYATPEDQVLNVAAPGVLANDIEVDGDTKTVSQVNGVPANVGTPFALASGALLTVNANGSFTYDPTAVAAFNLLGAGASTTDTFTYVISDGVSGGTPTATVTITINGVSDPPALDLDGDNSSGATGADYQTTFTEDGGAVEIADPSNVTLTDIDNTTMASITVTLTNLLDTGFETLDVDLVGLSLDGFFSKSYDTSTPGQGVLTISTTMGARPIAEFVTILQSIGYDNADDDPDLTARVITVVVNDGATDSNTATSTITVAAADDPPTFTSTATPSVAENTTFVVDVDATDPEGAVVTYAITGGADAADFSIVGATGVLTFVAAPDFENPGDADINNVYLVEVTASGGPTPGVQSLTVTVTNVNEPPAFTSSDTVSAAENQTAVVDVDATDPEGVAVTYAITGGADAADFTIVGATGVLTFVVAPDFENPGDADTNNVYLVEVTATDGTNPVPQLITVTVTDANDVPVVNAGGGAPSFTEDGAAVAIAPALTITDDSTNIQSATVQITGNYQNGQDLLNFTNQLGITGAFVAGTGTLTLTGPASVANFQTALRTVTYSNTSQNPNTTTRTATFVVTDDGALSSTGVTKDVAVVAVNDAPVITVTAGTVLTFTEGDAATVIDTGINVTDVDDTNIESATVQISANYENGFDVLSFTSQFGITTTGFNAATGTLPLSGSATLAQYITVLESVRFFNSSNNPSQLTRTITWIVHDGTDPSAGATNQVAVIAVNDPPTVVNESFDILGNTELLVDMSSTPSTPHTTEATTLTAFKGVLDNDSDPEGDSFAVTGLINCQVADLVAPFDCTLIDGSVIHVEATGEFSFVPAPGATTASFTYTVTDSPAQGVAASVNGSVTLNVVDMIWYVDADAATNGNGTSVSPFNALTDIAAGDGTDDDNADDYLFVYGATNPLTGGITLESGQRLRSEFVGLSIPVNLNGNGSPTNLVTAGGTRPVLGNAGGNAVSIGTANPLPREILGFVLSGSANVVDLTTTGAIGASTLAIGNNEISSAGAEGIDINLNGGTSGSLTLTLDTNSWNTANTHTGNAVDIVRSAGTLNLAFNNNTNIKSNGMGVSIVGGNIANMFITDFANNTVHQSTLGDGINIANATFDGTPGLPYNQVSGGNTAVGVSGDGVGSDGIVLTTVAGDLAFTDLDVRADNGAALQVTGTAAVNVGAGTGTRISVNAGVATLRSTGGPAVDISTATVALPINSLTVTSSPTTGVSLVSVSDGTAGANASFSAPSGSSITSTTGNAFNVSGGNATISYGGTITNTSGRAVSIASHGADTIAFTNTITDTGGTGILLDNNDQGSNSTISFNGGITLNGASSTFTATNGGIVNVTGTNTIGATTVPAGPAVNIANTTIGSNNVTFQRVSATGGANGIVLNTTGSSGGLTVTGTGSTDGSGGTIQSTTGVGVLMTSTSNVSLSNMNVLSSGDDGIRGQGVDNFTLNNGTLTNNGNATAENGLQFGEPSGSVAGITGTLTISDTTISGSAGNNVHIRNTSGTLASMSVTGSSFNDLNDVTGANSFLFEASGTSTVTEAFITSSTFSNNSPQRALEVQAHDTATVSDFVVSGSTFTGNGIHASFTQDTSSNLEFYFVNNNVTTPNTTDNVLQAVNVFSSSQSTGGTIVARISGNTINTNQEEISGISAVIQGRTVSTLLIDGNTVTGASPFGKRGISVAFRGPTAALGPATTHDLTITNNNVDNVTGGGGFPLAAISVEADNQSGSFGTAPTVRADIRLNTVPGSSCFDLTSGCLQYYEYDGDGTAGEGQDGIGQLVDTAPASANADAQLSSTNTGSVGSFGIALIAGPINTPPPVPTPLLADAGDVDAATKHLPLNTLAAVHDGVLRQSELDTVVRAAIARWSDAGLSAEQRRTLQTVTFTVADMPRRYLASFAPGHVTVDADAAGRGWFVDQTPLDDVEFTILSGEERRADKAAASAGRYDLLTAVMHEIGHVLGEPDRNPTAPTGDAMGGTLPVGVRRLPPVVVGGHSLPSATPPQR